MSGRNEAIWRAAYVGSASPDDADGRMNCRQWALRQRPLLNRERRSTASNIVASAANNEQNIRFVSIFPATVVTAVDQL